MSGIGQGLRVLLRGIYTLSTILGLFLTVFGVLLLIAMWLLLLLNTVNRWLDTSYVSTWTLEMVGWLVAWSIFVMMGPVARADEHIKVSFVTMKLLGEKRGTYFMRVLENLAGLAVCIFFSIHAFRWVINTYNMDYTMKSVAGWTYPLWVLRLAIFVGFSTAAYFYLDRTIKWVVSLVIHQEQSSPDHGGGL